MYQPSESFSATGIDIRIPEEYRRLWVPCVMDMALYHLTTARGLEGMKRMGHIEPRDPAPRNWAGMKSILYRSVDPERTFQVMSLDPIDFSEVVEIEDLG